MAFSLSSFASRQDSAWRTRVRERGSDAVFTSGVILNYNSRARVKVFLIRRKEIFAPLIPADF
jgi:hypothetical protein